MAKPHIHKGYKMYRRLIVDTVEPSRNEAKWSSRNFKWNYYVKKKKKKKEKKIFTPSHNSSVGEALRPLLFFCFRESIRFIEDFWSVFQI